MRLTCPNCEAQYEVPEEVIPESGRDVQCSSCGNTWFQYHPDHIPEPEAERLDEVEPDAATDWDEDAHDDGAPPDAADGRDLDTAAPEVDEETGEDARDLPRRDLDPEVRDILQEEAQREAAAREAERGGVETQPDLGLTEGPEDEESRRAREARSRVARLRGESTEADADDNAIDPTSRRDLLPDIEEISSSLRSEDGSDAATDPNAAYPDATAVPARSKGFRRGFLLVVLLAVLAALVYIYAPVIKETVPAIAGPLDAYVAQADQFRLWLDGQVRALMLWLDSQASTET